MKVAEENIIRLNRTVDYTSGLVVGMVPTPLETVDEVLPHDARGLVLSLLLCLCCWVVLAYFLLV